MQKNKDILKKRAEFIQKEINNRHQTEKCTTCVARLGRMLFLSETTIWRDFAKDTEKM